MKRFICILVLIWLASASKTRVSLDSLDSESIKFIKTFLDPTKYSTEERQSIQIQFVLNKSIAQEGKQAIEANQYNNLTLEYYKRKQFYSEFLKYLFCFASKVEKSNWRKSTESCRKTIHFYVIDTEFNKPQKELRQSKAPFIAIKGNYSETTSNFINIVLLEDFTDYVKKDFIDFLPIMLKKALMKAKWSLAVSKLILHSMLNNQSQILRKTNQIEANKEGISAIESLVKEKIDIFELVNQRISDKALELNKIEGKQQKKIAREQLEALEQHRNQIVDEVELLKTQIKAFKEQIKTLKAEIIENSVKLDKQASIYKEGKQKVNAMEEDIKTVLKQIESKQKPKKSWFFKWFSRNTDCFKLCGGE